MDRSKNSQQGAAAPVMQTAVMQGFQAAMDAGASEVAVFTAASEHFCKKNTNCSIEDSLKRIQDVVQCAMEKDIAVRGYVSCVVGCPYQVYPAHNH